MREWESDPLFAAAEVVQDSADRMESICRLLLHEQSVIQGDHKDGNLPSSIEYHRRDFTTALETAKWQLEDFEKEVNTLAFADKSQVKQNMITRHLQFVVAIREQISFVEQSMGKSLGISSRNMHLDEQDQDGLAIFLSGEKPTKHIAEKELVDKDILRSFLDPAVSSTSSEDSNGGKDGLTVGLLDRTLDLNESSQTKTDFGDEGSWDLEASGVESRNYLQNNKLRDYLGRMKFFCSFANLLPIRGNRGRRSFTKRLKDGEEQTQSPTYSQLRMQRYLACLRSNFVVSIFHPLHAQISARAMQSINWIGDRWKTCQRYFRKHPILFILLLLLTLYVLGICVS